MMAIKFLCLEGLIWLVIVEICHKTLKGGGLFVVVAADIWPITPPKLLGMEAGCWTIKGCCWAYHVVWPKYNVQGKKTYREGLTEVTNKPLNNHSYNSL